MLVIMPGVPRTVVSALELVDVFWPTALVELSMAVLLSTVSIARLALTLTEIFTRKAVFPVMLPRVNVTLFAGLGSPELNVAPTG